MENETLSVDLSDGVARLTLNRPDKKNAITRAMWQEIARRMKAFGADRSVRVVVLSGRGADFSAGADIGEFDAVRGDAASARDYEATNSEAFAAVRHAPVPVIAAIRGICFGGGFGLAAACDLRLATPDARFSVPAARLGLAYPHDAMVDIVSSLGSQMARYLTFTAARIDAEQARAAGFLLEIVADDDFDARVEALARSIAASAPLSVAASKAAIRAVATREPADVLRAQDLGDATFDSLDYAEGRAAFRARRNPVFTGR